MSKTKFQVDKELFVHGHGVLTHVIRLVNDGGASGCIARMIQAFSDIDGEYRKSVGNDGRIIGGERIQIMDLIDTFLDLTILLWKILIYEKGIVQNIHISNRQSGFEITFKEQNNFWEAQGQLSKVMISPMRRFQEIYGNRLSVEIKNFLETYKKAAADGVLDQQELEQLNTALKQVVYYTLFLRFQLEECLIDN